HVRARAADQEERLGQRPLVGQVVDRGQQLALGQVARRAEDDEHGRVDGQPLQALGERVCLQDGHDVDFLMAWPPNWLRSAALTFAANAFWPRDEKRSYRDVVMTGVGIRRSIPDSTVQRPSPESSTYGAISGRSLPSCSNALAASSHSHDRITDPCIQRCAIFALSSSNSHSLNSEKPSA